jgi:predicted ATPase/DNA-binding winged helix-turn-helix (wHTH) protein
MAQPPRHTLHFPPFRIPRDVDVLYREDAVVALEPRAVRVLRYLAQHHDRVVSKDELLEAVWPDVFTTDGVLKKAVSQARRALEGAGGSVPFIETHHGRGYRFLASVSVETEPAPADEPAAGRRADQAAPGGDATAGSEPGQRTNLPHFVTSFVGREQETVDIKEQLVTARLVTLTGPGGIGKTRLALETASGLLGEYADGVWLVELAPLPDPALVAQAVATTLGIREEPDRPLTGSLCERLADKRLLLVLDNCEHVAEACAGLVSALLRACGGLRVLATSREPLGIAGEAVRHVPGLSVPNGRAGASSDELCEFEAVRLFVDRARRSNPKFELHEGTAGAIAQLCRRLDGIALAIELAATRTRALSVEQIVSRLDDQLGLLTKGDRGAEPRQQTLRAAIDWSYALLTEGERVLLRRLSVFAGGWTLEAAEAVCGEGGGRREEGGGSELKPRESSAPGGQSLLPPSSFLLPSPSSLLPPPSSLLPFDVLDLLAHLVDKSLVIAEEHDGGTRYRMLEMIRQYARERLAESGEEARLLVAHRDWFLRLAEMAECELRGPEQRAWLSRLETEHNNFRAVLQRGAEDPEACLRLSGALGLFWCGHGHLSEGRRHLQAALERGAGAPATARAKALHWAGFLAYQQGDYERAEAHYQASLLLWRLSGDRLGLARVLYALGHLAMEMGDFDRGLELSAEGLDLGRQLADPRIVAGMRFNIGLAAMEQGDLDRAARSFEEGLAISREHGPTRGVATFLHNLSDVARFQGDLGRAGELLQECLALARELGDTRLVAYSLHALGNVANDRADYDQAKRLCREALTLHHGLAEKRGTVMVLETIACTAAAEGDATRALRLAGAALAIRQATKIKLGPSDRAALDQYLDRARQEVDDEQADQAIASGRAMTLDQATEYALRFVDR